MQAPGSLSPEQQSVLGAAFYFIKSSVIYLRSVLPVVSGPDEQFLQRQIKLGEMCLRRLPKYFPELQPLADEWKKRGGGQ